MDIMHRDVKAANVLLTHDGRAKLCDLGTAALPPNQVVGTPHWMAPEMLASEVAAPGRGYDSKVDI
eukprot:3377694-Prymnesium_polylepis.1